MNEFLKLCKENGIDLDGAQALLDMAGGDGQKAVEFIKYMQGGPLKETDPNAKVIKHGTYTERYKQGVSESMGYRQDGAASLHGYGKHGIKKGPNSDSSIYCGHANECPNNCDCHTDCYCRVHGNCGPLVE